MEYTEETIASGSGDGTVKEADTSKDIGLFPEQEFVLKELHVFLDGATRISKVRCVDVAKAGINLLKSTWAASDAVLEHMDNLFDESVSNYILDLELENNASTTNIVASDENIIQDIYKVLSEFVKEDPERWAPLISSWSLNLLGRLGSKYADRRVVPPAANLPEVLQLWMTCPPTRTLIDLAIQCFSTLINSNPDSCIDALIETSVQHSPHFDWVVAHIGSCFPMTVIARVLACGLKDFVINPGVRNDLAFARLKEAKIASVVGILGHLATCHNNEMRTAVRSLFNDSLSDEASREQLATGPFLLHLASMSDILSDVISSEFVKVVTPETLNMMSCQVEKWKSAQIPGTDGLIHLVVHLLLRSDGGSQVIRCLLDIMPPSAVKIHAVICDAAGLVLDSVLLEIQRRVYAGTKDIPLLLFLKMHIADLSSNLSQVQENKASWVFNLIKLICIHGDEPFTVFVIGFLLSNTENIASYIAALVQEIQTMQPKALSNTISHQMAELKSDRVEKPVTLVRNITSLCQVEKLQKMIIEGVEPNLEILSSQLSMKDKEYSDAVVELISLCVIPEQMSITSLFNVALSVGDYFFNLLARKNITATKKLSLVNIVKSLFIKLCRQTASQHMILRMLLEGILDEKYSMLFESKSSTTHISSSSSVNMSLLEENVKYMSSITLPPNHCSIFYSGVIGSGLRTSKKLEFLPPNETLLNRQCIIGIMQACCRPSWRFPLDELPNVHPQSLVPGMKIIALLMVELISPDVMFNGLPWPDEDYLKVTIERDLHIKQMFEKNTILWDLLSIVAMVHPSLCYVSVLLRAIMAVLISYWGSNQDKSTRNSPKQLQMTQCLINIMAIGQVLPPPLSYIDEVLPFVTPNEAFCLLSNIWQYMRDNVPSPALFTSRDQTTARVWRNFETNGNGKPGFCDKKYTNKLRCIMFANIEKFGDIYAKFFPLN